MRTASLGSCLVLLVCAAWAGEAAPGPAAIEIAHLFGFLQTSGCAFNRNGTWYTAAEASDHVRTKYNYLLARGLVTTAESFVDLAASRSSLSGRPYRVRCGDALPIDSGPWLIAELHRFRENERDAADPSPTRAPNPLHSPSGTAGESGR